MDVSNSEENEKRKEAQESLARMSEFDTSLLPRIEELGTALNFSDAVEPAERLVGLYQRISPMILVDLPLQQLSTLWTQANNDYSVLQQVLEFRAGQPDSERDAVIVSIDNAYQNTFNALEGLISFSVSRATDFQSLEREARATIQSVQDLGKKLTNDLDAKAQDAEQILTDIRKAAAEQGVSQQASYFKEAASNHLSEAEKAYKSTMHFAWALGIYAILSLFMHHIPWLSTSNTYESVQLGVSKTLIFAVLSYMLYLSVRNYLAHKHNAIINTHRQNALMTYTALIDASKDLDQKEVILNHAAACIFAPQSTGYSNTGSSDAPSAKSVVELLSRPVMGE
jgi:hypothetical protein